jgi:hypothetical protein
MINPLTKGKIRSGRDDGRPTEDDIARERQGDRGFPARRSDRCWTTTGCKTRSRSIRDTPRNV